MTKLGVKIVLAFVGLAIVVFGLTSMKKPSSRFFLGLFTGSNPVRCYATNGVQVCHNKGDESLFYDTPISEVAYNVQTIRNGQSYRTVYHSEPRNKPAGSGGDSLKVGTYQGAYNYSLPTNKAFKIWGTQTDSLSTLYSPIDPSPYKYVSGGGNPMMIAGRHWAGDNYYYLFFLVVVDSNWNRKEGENDYRHYLAEARTLDFVNFDIWTEINGVRQWKPYSNQSCTAHPYWCRARVLEDVNNQAIASTKESAPDQTQGLIGSIAIINNVYYYFYTDYLPNSSNFGLFYRTALDVSGNSGNYWSAPTQVPSWSSLPVGTLVRIGRAKNMNRWAVLYNCYNGHEDLCLQYTQNLNVIGGGGISSLTPSIDFNLELRGDGNIISGQPYLMTDIDGNLASPDTEDTPGRGGELRWTDFQTPGCGNAGCPVYGGKVWRAGWDISVP